MEMTRGSKLAGLSTIHNCGTTAKVELALALLGNPTDSQVPCFTCVHPTEGAIDMPRSPVHLVGTSPGLIVVNDNPVELRSTLRLRSGQASRGRLCPHLDRESPMPSRSR